MDEVRPLLENLRNRLRETWSPPYRIFVDNCCSQRLKLKEIFGPQTEVSLDIFHATQRITCPNDILSIASALMILNWFGVHQQTLEKKEKRSPLHLT